ncbi:MAG TPA: ABC transporter permease [Acidimicrobiales bacterium]|nr:ABC transporter permease [Acidimicrobiales bacterium]
MPDGEGTDLYPTADSQGPGGAGPNEAISPGAPQSGRGYVDAEFAGEEFNYQARSRARMVLRRFLRHRLAMLALCVFVAILLLAVVGGHLWKYNYTAITNDLAQGPSLRHPFGTDDIGHDLFAQVLHGAETSIETALLVSVVGTTIGVAVGAVAGYFGRFVDAALMRFTDLILTIPILAVLIVLAHQIAKQAGSWFWIGLLIAFLIWTYVARLVRGAFLSLREREFVEASRAIGASSWRIITRHLIPNAVGPIIVNASLTVATAVLLESTLSYLGLGVQPPNTSLGLLIANGQTAAFTEPWLFYFPAIFIVVIVLCLNFIGDGLRDAFDPGQTRVRA